VCAAWGEDCAGRRGGRCGGWCVCCVCGVCAWGASRWLGALDTGGAHALRSVCSVLCGVVAGAVLVGSNSAEAAGKKVTHR